MRPSISIVMFGSKKSKGSKLIVFLMNGLNETILFFFYKKTTRSLKKRLKYFEINVTAAYII